MVIFELVPIRISLFLPVTQTTVQILQASLVLGTEELSEFKLVEWGGFRTISGFLTLPSQKCYLGGTFSTVSNQEVQPDPRVDAGQIPAALQKQKIGYLQNNLLGSCLRMILKLPVTGPP